MALLLKKVVQVAQDHKYKLQALCMLPFFRLSLIYGGCGAVTTGVLVVTLRRTLWQPGRLSRSKASENVKPYAVMIQPYPKHPDGSPTITMDSYRKLEVIDQDDLYKTFDGSSKSWEKLAVCLCHMSKVGHPWKSFVAKLQGHPVFQALSERDKVTEASLLLWLLDVSDDDVKRHLMCEHMKHQPVPVATAWQQRRFCQELLWTMPEAPSLGSFKLNATVEGVSNLLNQTFDTNFERRGSRSGESRHPYTQIQFDADMKPESRRHFAVIDVHGTPQGPQGSWPLELAKSCQFLLVHIKEKDLKSREVQSFVKDVSKSARCKCLFIMIWDDVCVEVREDLQQGLEDPKVHILRIPASEAKHATASDPASIKMRQQLYPQLKYLGQDHQNSSEAVLRVDDLRTVMNVDEPPLWEKLRNITTSCAEIFCSTDDGLRNKKFPMMHHYIELCKVDRDLTSSKNADNRHEALDFLEKRDELQQKQKTVKPSNVSEEFVEILHANDSEANLEQLYKFMAEEFARRGKEDVDVQLAMSCLHKEVIQLYSHSAELNDKDGIIQAYEKLIYKGMPFEILDGDHMHFPRKFLEDLFKCLKERVGEKQLQVCSTAGPQSSGKSTLSNHRFGSRFGVSAGRCTRGIFGSFQVTDDAVMLVLDTEGLQSAERADPEFDRVMMLFIFAVSNYIDITVKGNMTEPLKKLIQVCVHAWKDLGVNKVAQPNIRWIMNQEAVQDPQHHEDAFQKMFEELKEVFSSDDVKSLRDVLRLDNPSIAIVPTMHSESTFVTNAYPEKFTRLMKADSFNETCADLTRTMLRHFSTNNTEDLFGLESWLEMSLSVFQTITTFPNLTSLSDIKQINQSRQMNNWIDSKMRSAFWNPEKRQKHDEVKIAVWKECLEAAGAASIRDQLPVKLKQAFDDEVGDLKQQLEAEMKKRKCDDKVRRDMSQLLGSLLGRECSGWLRGGVQEWQKWLVGRARSQGHERLNSAIRRLLRSPGTVSDEDQANKLFDELWLKILKEMQHTLDRDHFDKQLFNDIHEFFPAKERKGRLEIWGQAEKMKQNAEDFAWKSSERFLCPLRPSQQEKVIGKAEPRSEYKYVKLPGKLSRNLWIPNLFGPLPEPLCKIMMKQPDHSRAGFAPSVDWCKIQGEVLRTVTRNLPSDPQPSVRGMQEIYQQVCEVADAVNAELAEFQQELSLEARGEMVTLAIIRTWQSMSQAAWQEHMKPIEEFKAEETKQRKYFCSQVLQCSEADHEMAKRWIARIAQSCREKLSVDAAKNVGMEIAEHQESLSRKAIEGDSDRLLGSDELDKQEEYILDPIKTLEKELHRRFTAQVDPGIKRRQEELFAEVRDRLGLLRSELRSLRDKSELQAEKALVEARDFANDPCETEYTRKQALASWIVAFLTMDGDLPSKLSLDENEQLVACDDEEDGWQVKMSQALPCTGSPVKDESVRSWIQAANLERVGNLHYFVTAAVEELDRQIESLGFYLQDQVRSSVEKKTKELKDKLIPCPVRCPCCGRLCANPDPNHTVHYACGHYPRGFTGRYVRFSSGKEIASTLMCTEMKENTSVYEPGYHRAITWKEFKEKDKDCKDWDFGESDPDRHDFEGKAQKAWKKVGPRFCRRFQTTFTEYGEQSTSTPRSRHYLLILDSSGSMSGGKWNAVVEAMRQMARSESELALESKFSVILFSDFAHMAVSNCAASEILESRFDPLFSGTRFADAFQCAADFVRDTDFADRCPMVVFMTDGQDWSRNSQRTTAIRNLVCEFNDKQQSWDFRAIAFGDDADRGLLQGIADKQVGRAAKSSKYMEASTEMDLVQAFLEIAQAPPNLLPAASKDCEGGEDGEEREALEDGEDWPVPV